MFTQTLLSQDTLTVREIFDFEVGDHFHYRIDPEGTLGPPNAQRYKIIQKYYSAGMDTLFYVRSYNNYYTMFNSSPTPHLDSTFAVGLDTLVVTKLDSLISSLYFPIDSTQFFDSTATASDTTYISSTYCGQIVYQYNYCYGSCTFEPIGLLQTFGKGLGMVDTFSYVTPWPEYSFHQYLTYYKKGTDVCGDDVPVEVPTLSNLDHLRFYPNPANESLTVDVTATEKISYQILDLQGRMVSQGYLNTGKNILNVEALSEGMYVLKTDTGAKHFEVIK